MVHKDVLKKFKQLVNVHDNDFEVWFPNGRNSVRVRFKDGTELVFTYMSMNNWRLETKDSFINSMPISKDSKK